MAPGATPSLRRLLRPEVALLLDDLTAALPGLRLAIVAPDGTVARRSGDWPADGEGRAADDDASGDGGARRLALPLAPRGEELGSLVAVGEAPEYLLRGLQRSLTLLLGELLDKHDLARETLERYREINLLYRSGETVGASLDASDVPRLVLSELERVISAPVALVLLGEGAGAQPRLVESQGTPHDIASLCAQAERLITQVTSTGRPDIAVWQTADEASLSSAVCVPILPAGRVLGTVVMGRRDPASVFSAGDEKLLLALAGQAGVALERARLHEQETRRQRLEEELDVARRIQLSLLPTRPPAIPGWSFAASYEAARQVGGDFFDFLDHAVEARRRLGVVVADVTGKGVPAALMMAYSRAVLRAESLSGRRPSEVLGRTNELIMRDRQTRLFLSAFYAELDLDSGRLVFSSAGHDAPLWVASGGTACRELDAPGVILGAFHDIGLEEREIDLEPGDSLVLYTDGVTEARDPEGRLFGEERLAEAATTARGGAQSVLDSIAGAVSAFTAGAPQADDLTIVVVQRDDGG